MALPVLVRAQCADECVVHAWAQASNSYSMTAMRLYKSTGTPQPESQTDGNAASAEPADAIGQSGGFRRRDPRMGSRTPLGVPAQVAESQTTATRHDSMHGVAGGQPPCVYVRSVSAAGRLLQRSGSPAAGEILGQPPGHSGGACPPLPSVVAQLVYDDLVRWEVTQATPAHPHCLVRRGE
eukprot:CAMPEP_0181200538 /NCGR_PEP_ID=MMETSP1096-20121128/17821_1 /TAXON_ID=156174 ORGANISM="Chrysochromulina ericina, Strain CCMP281" /NCGR_SAMPLE_ID=MMETSP1096 /ASSEMBLY_ACC=CAM_ASM_000453 /LENGTH=180 /DNA_ID=CAMNT_0023290909 /DNA_START=350 /DNA_END=894 /DNA_ORIENTATION=+